ncbi:MAG: ribosome-binding factor A [Zetaproteobacteria bacterium CG_4_9_14_3_um_filter_49_83]|nr:MAG: ribosome-binding factor A [Zetaproteobacteria bacterium CG1_02_49_23]PIQ33036.1 MAG: ribosome-binding factor A [Zetaproteobacteria bacterium CG17_big_fil_post_rev_8_21_14_2_50_50_13]PIV31289.1 MAG: ribosome-binding factor A [Zetaproteobacteria bacterium CG02_land_8_20_14_3_00_50_9]PIY55193.1 MAG: ribosome-binding factor A [Zetaproteobacteria bacterium CG_4_10_14_0_8_um_filter_49_80]PJA35562.1 MAG: ribosome-binding factor A [Zetaproteobacteria bacterium CG_4_9_14_3_um_filter_49_83]
MQQSSRLPVRHRLQTDIHRLLTTLMQRDIDDPRLAGITITEVAITKNSESAVIKIHHMQQVDQKLCVEKLNHLAKHFEYALRQSLKKRRIPALEFVWDVALDKGNAVLDILHGLKTNG